MGRTMIVAELSANHGHKLEIALESVRAAARAGADAVKIQTYTADTITLNCDKEDFVVKGTSLWDNRTLYNLYQEAYTPWEWHKAIFDEAGKEGIICFSTPFDKTAVDFLEELGNPFMKIASFEITDIPLIRYAASKRKPMVISTGIATLDDIALAVQTCREAGNNDITLLKCTSAYPAPIDAANLLTMNDMARRFGVKTGVSDHTAGSQVAVTAVKLGATMVEKHFILDRSIGGPDAAFSMQIDELGMMVKEIRDAENGEAVEICNEALGKVFYPTDTSKITGRQFCRSLYAALDIRKGDMITEENVRSVRPGYGLHPKYLPDILGKEATCDVKAGTRFSLEFVK